MPRTKLKPTTAEEREEWKRRLNNPNTYAVRPLMGKNAALRLLADFDRLSEIIVAMHHYANGDNISGVLCEAQDYFETYGGVR